MPSHADERRVRRRPGPVDARVKRIGERADGGFVGISVREILAAGEDAGEEERGVYSGELDGLEPEAGVRVEEVIEESLVAGDASWRRALGCVVEEVERCAHARRRVWARHVAALDADDVCGKPEADRGHGRE